MNHCAMKHNLRESREKQPSRTSNLSTEQAASWHREKLQIPRHKQRSVLPQQFPVLRLFWVLRRSKVSTHWVRWIYQLENKTINGFFSCNSSSSGNILNLPWMHEHHSQPRPVKEHFDNQHLKPAYWVNEIKKKHKTTQNNQKFFLSPTSSTVHIFVLMPQKWH